MACQTAETIHELLFEGRAKDAYALALREYGDQSTWNRPGRRSATARLAGSLGFGRLSVALAWRAAADSDCDPMAPLLHLEARVRLKGPWPALLWLRSLKRPHARPSVEARLHMAEASLYARFRDFERADQAMAKAAALAPKDLWVLADRLNILYTADRKVEYRALAQEVYEEHKRYVPFIHAQATALVAAGDDEAAEAILREGADATQAISLCERLSAHLENRCAFEESRAVMEAAFAETALTERDYSERRARVRARHAFLCGDFTTALTIAQDIDSPYFQRIAAACREGQTASERRRLDVPYVSQDFMTCGPATLTGLARFHGVVADHLEVATAICHFGTTSLNERRWAIGSGFATAEFTLTFDSARRLIDCGLPFAVSTKSLDSGHLQAIVGYDPVLRSFLIRDSNTPIFIEVDADRFLESYAHTGPRAMVFAPKERAEELRTIELQDRELWELFFQLEGHLDAHERERAVEALTELQQKASEHFITIDAESTLGYYDADDVAKLQACDRALKHFPKSQNLRLRRAWLGLRLEPRNEWMRRVSEEVNAPFALAALGPLYATELVRDGGSEALAHQILLHSHRHRPNTALVLAYLADWYERALQPELEEELRRFVTCMNPKDLHALQHWLAVAETLGRAEAPLKHLAESEERMRPHDGEAAGRYADILMARGEPAAAQAVLIRSYQARPDDGARALKLAEFFCDAGEPDKARTLLTEAQCKLPEQGLMALEARLAEDAGDLETALRITRQMLTREPLNGALYQRVVDLIEQEPKDAAAREAEIQSFARESIARFPHWIELRRTTLEWSRNLKDEDFRVLILEALSECPKDAWMWRELALCDSRLGRAEDVRNAMAKAEEFEGRNLSWFSCGAVADQTLGELEAAAGLALEGLERYGYGHSNLIQRFVGTATTPEERKQRLQKVALGLRRTPHAGEAFRTFVRLSSGLLNKEEIEGVLAGAQQAAPHSLPIHIAMAEWLLYGQSEEERALHCLDETLLRFPRWVQGQQMRAEALRRMDKATEATLALESAVRLAPTEPAVAEDLIRHLLQQGDEGAADNALKAAIARMPGRAELHLLAADRAWTCSDLTLAEDCFRRSLQYGPHDLSAWAQFSRFAQVNDRYEAYEDALRSLKARCPQAPMTWRIVALYSKDCKETLDERIEAARRAMELAPRWTEAHDGLCYVLTLADRYEEALHIIEDEGWRGQPPTTLLIRKGLVLLDRGDKEAALAHWESLLENHSDSDWLWECLLGTLEDDQQWAKITELTERGLASNPSSAYLHSRRGRAYYFLDDHDAASASLQRAHTLNPRDHSAAELLFDLADKRSDVAEMMRLNAFIRPEVLPGVNGFHDAKIAIHQRDAMALEAAMVAMATTDHLTYQGYDQIAERVKDGPLRAAYARGLDIAIGRGLAARPAAYARASLCQGDADFGSYEALLETLSGQSPAFQIAADPYLRYLIDIGESPRFERFVLRHEAELRSQLVSYGAVGAGFCIADRYAQALDWYRDWETREDLEPFVLYGVSVAAIGLGLNSLVLKAAHFGVDMPGDPVTSAQLKVFIASVKALRGTPLDESDLDLNAALLEGEPEKKLFALLRIQVQIDQGLPLAVSDLRGHMKDAVDEPITRFARRYRRLLLQRVTWKIKGLRQKLMATGALLRLLWQP